MLYRGRFAPTPSGPLHPGSLVAALASWLDAKWHDGKWLVRIDDLDPPREAPGATDQILSMLEACALEWDEPVLYQSQRQDAYQAAIEQLLQQQQAFYCTLSRKQLQAFPHHPGPNQPQPAKPGPQAQAAIRILAPKQGIHFQDRFQGLQTCSPDQIDHFVIRRRDGLYAYQLATALDDHYQKISHVVRGKDLLGSTGRQIHVMQSLGYCPPIYGHIGLLTNTDGEKLSKSSKDLPLDPAHPGPALCSALEFLDVPVEENLYRAAPATILSWAREWTKQHWQQDSLANCQSKPIKTLPFNEQP